MYAVYFQDEDNFYIQNLKELSASEVYADLCCNCVEPGVHNSWKDQIPGSDTKR
jgi:hypothetical protein